MILTSDGKVTLKLSNLEFQDKPSTFFSTSLVAVISKLLLCCSKSLLRISLEFEYHLCNSKPVGFNKLLY